MIVYRCVFGCAYVYVCCFVCVDEDCKFRVVVLFCSGILRSNAMLTFDIGGDSNITSNLPPNCKSGILQCLYDIIILQIYVTCYAIIFIIIII